MNKLNENFVPHIYASSMIFGVISFIYMRLCDVINYYVFNPNHYEINVSSLSMLFYSLSYIFLILGSIVIFGGFAFVFGYGIKRGIKNE